MKKIVPLLLAALLLVGCGGSSSASDSAPTAAGYDYCDRCW